MASNGGEVRGTPSEPKNAVEWMLVVKDERDRANAAESELAAIKATHIYRWIEKCQIAREALAEIRDLDPSLTADGFDRDELSSYSVEVGELAELALRDTE